jgi:hypothetical protein
MKNLKFLLFGIIFMSLIGCASTEVSSSDAQSFGETTDGNKAGQGEAPVAETDK